LRLSGTVVLGFGLGTTPLVRQAKLDASFKVKVLER
jgi:hypothetical protein